MGRRRAYVPLNVLLNNRLVGQLTREANGATEFCYDDSWLGWEHSLPISLSMPLREERFTGRSVAAVFENLLPDANPIRKRIAERVGAAGTDAYSLLSIIGRDCVGALQFVREDETPEPTDQLTGTAVSDDEIGELISELAKAPLGLDEDDDFRISIAGAQEKTALLFHDGQWIKPAGTTPTTHLFKPQIGRLPNGIDLSNSVENEFYCLKLMEGFGLPVNAARMEIFGEQKALVIERFDRRWAKDGRLLRLPQEDCCQALSVEPTLKYQNQGGPGIVDILKLLRGSDEPAADQAVFLKSQILFWMIGATDGHGKNFSLFITPGGRYRLTPLYDVLTAQPSLDTRQIERKQMKLAMSVGRSRHYKISDIRGRHFIQTGEIAGLSKSRMSAMMDEIRDKVDAALVHAEQSLPSDFPETIHSSVTTAVKQRMDSLTEA